VRPSRIKGAGQGLFAARRFTKDAMVTTYSGDVLTKAQADATESCYIVRIHGSLFLDAEPHDTCPGRYINDGPRSGIQPNVRFAAGYNTNLCPGGKRRWIKVFAL